MAIIPSGAYSLLLIGITTLWPLFFLITDWPLAAIIMLTIFTIALMTLVWKYTSSQAVSFIKGMDIISAHLSSGCANLTIIYLIPYLTGIYLTLALLQKGIFRSFSREI